MKLNRLLLILIFVGFSFYCLGAKEIVHSNKPKPISTQGQQPSIVKKKQVLLKNIVNLQENKTQWLYPKQVIIGKMIEDSVSGEKLYHLTLKLLDKQAKISLIKVDPNFKDLLAIVAHQFKEKGYFIKKPLVGYPIHVSDNIDCLNFLVFYPQATYHGQVYWSTKKLHSKKEYFLNGLLVQWDRPVHWDSSYYPELLPK